MTLTLRPIDAADWPAIAAGFRDLGFEQTLAYSGAAAARIGARLEPVGIADAQGRWLAAAALRVKVLPGLNRGIAWAPSGPLILPRDVRDPDAAGLTAILAALRTGIAGRKGHILRLRLSGTALYDSNAFAGIAAEAGFIPAPRPGAYRSIAIDLERSPEALMAALQGKWRTDLRYAQKSGLVLDRGQGAAHEARFMALFDKVQSAKGFRPDIPPEFHFPLSCAEYRVETLIAVKDGQDVAGIVVGTSGPVATYLFGATADAGRPLRAGYFLTWEAILAAREQGCRWYELGGVDADANPDVARFKDRMNGVPLLAEVWQASPPGLAAPLILGLEDLRARLRHRRGSGG